MSDKDERLWWAEKWERRSAWLARHANSVEPLRRFWQREPFFTHLDGDGTSLGSDWRLVTAAELEGSVRRAMALALGGSRQPHVGALDVDDLEVFVPRTPRRPCGLT